ncbi:hypothetical protein V5O48_010668 [Marasmius crinis-equi]|uniref:AAA+ ATPase domain-containing protein n=1 Tax=Marasmius crinis-equi TaxID=585013 RepID=A0ABR3F7P4_9AGAR
MSASNDQESTLGEESIRVIIPTQPLPSILRIEPPPSDTFLRDQIFLKAKECNFDVSDNTSMYLRIGRTSSDPSSPEQVSSPRDLIKGGTDRLLASSCTYGEVRTQISRDKEAAIVLVPKPRVRGRSPSTSPPTKRTKSAEKPVLHITNSESTMLLSFLYPNGVPDMSAASQLLSFVQQHKTILVDPTQILSEHFRLNSRLRMPSLVIGEPGSGKTLLTIFATLLFDVHIQHRAQNEGIWKTGEGVLGDLEIAEKMKSGEVAIEPNTHLCLCLSFRVDGFEDRPTPQSADSFEENLQVQISKFCNKYTKRVPRLRDVRDKVGISLVKRVEEVLKECGKANWEVVILIDDIDTPFQLSIRERLLRGAPDESRDAMLLKNLLEKTWQLTVSLCQLIENGLAMGTVAHAFMTTTWPIAIKTLCDTTAVTCHRHLLKSIGLGSGAFSLRHLEHILGGEGFKHAVGALDEAHPEWRVSLENISSGGYHDPVFFGKFMHLIGYILSDKNEPLPRATVKDKIRTCFNEWETSHTREEMFFVSRVTEILKPIGREEDERSRDTHEYPKLRLVLEEHDVHQFLDPQPSLLPSELAATGSLTMRTALILLKSEGVVSIDGFTAQDGSEAAKGFLKLYNSNLDADIQALRVARSRFGDTQNEIDLALLPTEIEIHLQRSFKVDRTWVYNEHAFQDYVLEILRSNKSSQDGFCVAKEIELRKEKCKENGSPYVGWGFLDLTMVPAPRLYKGVICDMELKSIKIEYLYYGEYGSYPQNLREIQDYGELVMTRNRDDILEMWLRYWDRNNNREVIMQVKEVMKAAQDQVAAYVVAMANGHQVPFVEKDGKQELVAPDQPVCTDYRVTVDHEPEHAHTTVKGYVLLNVGHVRVIGENGRRLKMQEELAYNVAGTLPPIASDKNLQERREKQSKYESQFVPVQPYHK